MTQQDDITQRLRDNADLDEAEHGNARVVQLERDAADEIERLRAELCKLRAPVADERAVQLSDDERAANTPIKAAYVDHFGHAAGWLSYKGSWFTEGFHAGRRAALASAPVAGEAVTWEAVRQELAIFLMGATGRSSKEWHRPLDNASEGGALAKMRACLAAPQASESDFAKLQSAYVGACDQIAELLAEKQASAENDWKAAIRKFMDTAIPALAAIANVHTPDEIDALDALPREPVIGQIRRLSQACEELSRQVRPERPKADKGGARCTCPSGDGSLHHPCPAHPRTNEGRA